MRSASAILFVTCIIWAGWTSAQTLEEPENRPRSLPPGVSLDDAGMAAAFGRFLCGIPGGQIDAFRQKVDSLTSGGTHNSDFLNGEARARKQIDQVRQSDADNGDTRELADSNCHGVAAVIRKTLAVP